MRFEDLRLYLDEMRKPVRYQKQIDAESAALLMATEIRFPSHTHREQPATGQSVPTARDRA